jgi:hypothetical protein
LDSPAKFEARKAKDVKRTPPWKCIPISLSRETPSQEQTIFATFLISKKAFSSCDAFMSDAGTPSELSELQAAAGLQ